MRLGPVLREADDRFSAAVILAATFLGLQEGYGRLLLVADLRPQGLPVLTSTHSSLNHFFKAAPFLLFLTATLLIPPVLCAYLTAFRYSTRGIRRRPNLITRFDLFSAGIVCLFLSSLSSHAFYLSCGHHSHNFCLYIRKT